MAVQVNDVAIKRLGEQCSTLTSLNVTRSHRNHPQPSFQVQMTPITDVGLAQLQRAAALSHLTTLNIAMTAITDQGFCAAAPDLPRLQSLVLSLCKVGDSAVRCIAQHCRELTGLKLGGCNVTDAGVAELGQLEHLKEIDLMNNAITDKGASALLSSGSSLEIVNLSRCSCSYGVNARVVHESPAQTWCRNSCCQSM